MKLWRIAIVGIAGTVPFVRGLLGAYSSWWSTAVLCLILLSILLARCDRPPRANAFVTVGGLLFVATVASTAQAHDPQAAVTAAIQLLIMSSCAPFVVTYLYRRHRRTLYVSAIAFTLAQSVSSLTAVLQAGGVNTLGYVSLYGRSPGLAGHPNTMGVMAAVAILLLVSHLQQARSPRAKLSAASLGLINLAGLVVTGSTSSMLALAVGALVYACLMRLSLRAYWRATVAVVALIAASLVVASQSGAFESPIDRLAQVTGQTEEISTLNDRFRTIAYAWDRVQEDPIFGAGMDDVSGGTFDGLVLTHNLPMRAWFQGGIFAALAILLIYSLIIVAVLDARRTHASGASATLAVASVIGTFALTSAMFQQPLYWAVLATAITVGLCLIDEGGQAIGHPKGTRGSHFKPNEPLRGVSSGRTA